MRIGILTYHRAENYGALLQAYALRKYLQQYVDDVSFVDYWPAYHVEHYKLFSLKKFSTKSYKGKFAYIFYFVIYGWAKYRRKSRLTRFMREYLNIEKKIKYKTEKDICQEYDVAIYGSDQIWRKQNLPDYKGYNSWYFASNNINASRKIAYAGSMGIIDADDADIKYLKNSFFNFDAISVRELDLQSFLADLGIKTHLVIDPVFLLQKEEWRKLVNKKKNISNKKYILFYNLLNTSESLQFSNYLADKYQLPIKEINMKMSFNFFKSNYIKAASIEKFLQLIDDAECVISNSFHGVAFSIIFEKEFYAVGLREKSSRVISLLKQADIEKRYIKNEFVLDYDCINYEKVNSNICKIVEQSKCFLKENLFYENT